MNFIIGKKYEDTGVSSKIIVKVMNVTKKFITVKVIESNSSVINKGFVTTFNKKLINDKRFKLITNKIKKL